MERDRIEIDAARRRGWADPIRRRIDRLSLLGNPVQIRKGSKEVKCVGASSYLACGLLSVARIHAVFEPVGRACGN